MRPASPAEPCPDLAGKWLPLLFCIARPRPQPAWNDIARSCVRLEAGEGGLLSPAYSWGSGPAVLLVHGLHGCAFQFHALIRALVAAGFRAVALDAPAHGSAPGIRATPYDCREAIRALVSREPALHGIIGHSSGNLWSLGLADLAGARKRVCISSPRDFRFVFDSFCRRYLPPGGGRELAAAVEASLGRGIWEDFSLAGRMEREPAGKLFIHDRHDELVPFDQHQELSRNAVAGRAFLATSGAGHLGILEHPLAIGAMIDFLSD